MINRTLIRAKVAQLTYSTLQNGDNDHPFENLVTAIEASQKLYNYLFTLIVKVTDYQRHLIETAKQKWMPTQEERNPDTRFIDNAIPRLIAQVGSDLLESCDKEGISSDFDTALYRSLFEAIQATEAYTTYVALPAAPTFEQDRDLWVNALTTVFANHAALDEALEEKNLYWNDDLSFVLRSVVKTVSTLKPNTDLIAPMTTFKDKEDRQFAKNLLDYTTQEYPEYVRLIGQITPNWEVSRIALMDKVIMVCALAEIRHFPSIAAAVSINEYVELSKHYCSHASASFINGILDRITRQWREDNLIAK